MTCGLALKRPYDYEAYLSPDGGSQAKRQRQSPHCSPFRPQLGTIAASLPTSSALKVLHKNDTQVDDSPFATINGGKLSSAQLESYLRAEVKFLRRRKLIPRRREDAGAGPSIEDAPSTSYRAMSPASHSGSSDSEGELSAGNDRTPRAARQMSPTTALYDKPQFSLKQVQLICERLLKEQEVRLRYEYETVLSKKLEEQHEQYVQFAQEQFQEKFVHPTRDCDFSYVS